MSRFALSLFSFLAFLKLFGFSWEPRFLLKSVAPALCTRGCRLVSIALIRFIFVLADKPLRPSWPAPSDKLVAGLTSGGSLDPRVSFISPASLILGTSLVSRASLDSVSKVELA